MVGIDPIKLTSELIKCPSVTPADAGVLDLISTQLESLGFTCTRLPFGSNNEKVDNLFARIGSKSPHFCFAGHVDVVPEGDSSSWSTPPFSGEIKDGKICGRGASDMKGAIACFISAISKLLRHNNLNHGSISLLLTGDEEGPAINGTVKVLEWMKNNNQLPDITLVGEPTNPKTLGDTIKIGRRGSMTCTLVVKGTQGHVAYPKLANNPIPILLELLNIISKDPLDEGSANFEASNLEITTIDVGNKATNVIPEQCRAIFNIRFNDNHSSEKLINLIEKKMNSTGHKYDISYSISGESFLSPPGTLTDLIKSSIKKVVGIDTKYSTDGGTSDARFIKNYSPVAEFGLVNKSIHKIDENVTIEDLENLTEIYRLIIKDYLNI